MYVLVYVSMFIIYYTTVCSCAYTYLCGHMYGSQRSAIVKQYLPSLFFETGSKNEIFGALVICGGPDIPRDSCVSIYSEQKPPFMVFNGFSRV